MKSDSPQDRLGVYKTLDDVAARWRLGNFEPEYEGRDVWSVFAAEQTEQHTSTYFREGLERCERSWKQHLTDRGRHHALAEPADVETWAGELLDRVTAKTAYNQYWVHVEKFYRWLVWHPDHPHRYSPVLMAASDGRASEIWAMKLEMR